MSDTGVMFAMGHCAAKGRDCEGLFSFDPDRVPSVYARGHGSTFETSPGPREGFYREPICPPCAKAINAERRRRGMDAPLYEGDTAYDLTHGTPHIA